MAKIPTREIPIPEAKCYMEGKVSPGETSKPPRSSTVESELSEAGSVCSCGASKDSNTTQQSDPSITVQKASEEGKDSQLEDSITKVPSDPGQSGLSSQKPGGTEGEEVKEDGVLVSSSRPENESESNVKLGQEGRQTKNQAEEDSDSRPLVFVDNCFDDSFRDAMQEASLQQLQTTLKELDLESSEITLDSSGTGTHADISGETSLYTSCSTDLSANVTDDSLLDKRVLSDKKEGTTLPVSENKPITSSPTQSQNGTQQDHSEDQMAPQGLSPLSLTEHMQIGNITYFQYSSLEEAGTAEQEGRETSVQRAPSKSDPIPMPHLGKEEVLETRSSSSFGSFTSSPHISAFVNYATGLFRSTADDHRLVKDITEVPPGEAEVDDSGASQTEVTPVKTDKGLESSDKHVNVENAVKLGDMPELFQSIEGE